VAVERTTFLRRAQDTLSSNDRGGYTIPAPKLYPHQWNWDSAFCAIGWSHIDPRRAAQELDILMRGQWQDGLVPHILFNPAAEHYEPGPAAWGTIDVPGAPSNVRTSSITQPPVAATAARIVLERAGGDAQVEQVLRSLVPKLERWHAWFLATRDPSGEGLPCIVHPWESGMDNAPRWDAGLARIEPGTIEYRRIDNTVVDPSQRPTRYDYDRYFFIVRERARLGFAPPDPATEPFLMQDVAMAAILCRAERDLGMLAAALGASAPQAEARRARVAAALNATLLDVKRGSYHDRDPRTRERLSREHVAGLLPLFAEVVPDEVVAKMVARLESADEFGTPWPVPSVHAKDPLFDARRYWRGPSWVQVNWMLIDGLERAGASALAGRLAARTVEMVERSGFREYFDPMTGEGLGAEDFAWTAALVLDLLQRGH
jgi:glycogen debranching enzyme